jgi:murein DD-endopeptidase MepM/ murein hydrolase activator NlpD
MYKYFSSTILLLILASCSKATKAPITIQKESTKKILNYTTKALNQKYHLKHAEVALLYNLHNSKSDFIDKNYVNIINNSKYNKNFLASKLNFNKGFIEKNAKTRLQQFGQIISKLAQNKIHFKGLKISKNQNHFNNLVNLHNKHAKFLPILFPSNNGYITSRYGVRYHPIQKKQKFHYGIDIASQKRLIFSAAEGVITKVDIQPNGYGKNIAIDHASGIKTFYAHLSKIFVSPKQKVLQGELIGIEGDTGSATGIHLHFETIYQGRKINPMLFFISA